MCLQDEKTDTSTEKKMEVDKKAEEVKKDEKKDDDKKKEEEKKKEPEPTFEMLNHHARTIRAQVLLRTAIIVLTSVGT